MSSSESSQSSSSSTSTTSKPVTLQDVSGMNVIADGNVTWTDGGAISAMANLSNTTIEQAAKITLGIVDRQLALSENALSAVRDGQQQANEMITGFGAPDTAALQNTTQMILILAGVVAVVIIWKSMK